MLDKIAVDAKVPSDNIPKVDLSGATISNALSAVFVVIGGMAVLFLLIGAIKYITSNGDQGRVTKAKNTILYAVIGIIVAVSAFTVVQVVAGVVS